MTEQGFGLGRLPVWVIVIPVALIQVFFTFGAAYGQGELEKVNAGTVVLLLASALTLLLRRRYPVSTLAAVWLIDSVYFGLDNVFGPVFGGMVIAIFNAALNGQRLAAWVTCYGGATVMFTAMLMGRPDVHFDWFSFGAVIAWLGLVMTAGEIAKGRKERLAQARATAAEQQKRQASEERLRIAREVHDVLAHHVSLINVQSGVALHLIDEQPDQARQALTAIKASSKEVLVELRNILGVLRDVDNTDGAPRQPVASLDQLDRLLDRMRSAGLPVEVAVEGEARPLPSGVDAAALRIVQESLTNTYRHAGPTTATVTLRYEPADLVVEIVDDGRGDAGAISSEGTGNGLAGMRQRAEALNGTLTAGPRDGGGFRVTATLPTGSPRRTNPEDSA
jgi:signal transduction histidine kinase